MGLSRLASVFPPKRVLGFALTTAVLLIAVSRIPVNRERALALTAEQVAVKEVFPAAAEAFKAAHDDTGEAPVAVRLSCDCTDQTRERLLGTPQQAFTFVDDTTAPVLVVRVSSADHFAEVSADLPGLESAVEGRRRVGDWRATLPPLFAILVALYFRRVLLAMGGAVFLGALLHFQSNPAADLWQGASVYYWGNISEQFKLYIMAFTFARVGMVIVATRAGGSQGLINLVGRVARSARSTRIATFLMGVAIFFDDYANTIVVGTTARPMSDDRRISREKLAYLVDSTAAPIAGLAVISTWVAYEVGLLKTLIEQVGLDVEAFTMLVSMLPLRFYCVFCLLFVFVGSVMGRDYGPMLKAERRAAETGEVLGPNAQPLASRSIAEVMPAAGIPHRWYNAVVPIAVVVLSVIFGMLWTGRGAVAEAGEAFDLLALATWKEAFGNADSGLVLFVAALLGSAVAIALAVGQRLLTLPVALVSWLRGVPAMGLAIAILVSAWAIQSVCDDLGTNIFIVAAIGESIPAEMFPLFAFLAAAGVAFATGTSWGTMGILLPMILPWAHALAPAESGASLIVLLSAAAVLDGAIMGDHCSPISDTTVMSSMATSCDHVDHVRTQMPYALTCTALASLAYLGMALGMAWWVVVLLALVAIPAIFALVGKPINTPSDPQRASSLEAK